MPRRRQMVGCALVLAFASACGGISNGPEPGDEVDPDPGSPTLVPNVARYPDITTGPGTIDEGLSSLNRYRQLAGLGSVVLDQDASAACMGHLQYLLWESEQVHEGACELRHDEPNDGNPHRTDANEQAGMGALLACDRTSPSQLSLARAVDRWINSLYHRLPVLDPGLSRVGAAQLEGFVCLHYAKGTSELGAAHRVLWPPAETVDVPRAFVGRENPCPSTPASPGTTSPPDCPTAGFIVTATWFGPAKDYPFADTSPSVGLFDGHTGEPVELVAWYADGVGGHDPLPGLVDQTVALVPAAPLNPGARYRVVVGAPGHQETWTFRTGDRTE